MLSGICSCCPLASSEKCESHKLQVMNRTGCQMEALYFGDPELLRSHLIEKYGENEVQKLFWGKENRTALDVTYYPSINEYQGRKTLQIVIRHFR